MKKSLVVLFISLLVVGLFVSCKPEPEVPEVHEFGIVLLGREHLFTLVPGTTFSDLSAQTITSNNTSFPAYIYASGDNVSLGSGIAAQIFNDDLYKSPVLPSDVIAEKTYYAKMDM